MSTLSPAPRHADAGGAGTVSPTRRPPPRAIASAAIPTLLAGLAFALIAFVTTGGGTLGPNTIVEILLIVAGAGAAGVLIVRGASGRREGAVTFALLAGVAALTAASIAWSVTPDLSWVEADRTLAYLAAFGVALAAARCLPRGWTALLGGLALAAVAICGWAAIVKALDLPADGQPQIGRLLAPFGYWNATGLAASIGLPPLVWSAARRSGPAGSRSAVVRGVAVGGLALLIVVDVLSYSRSAVLAGILGLAAVFVLSGSRLRSALVLAVAAAPAAGVCAWALSQHGLTGGIVAHAARESAGRSFLFVLLGGLVVATGAGWCAVRQADRTVLSSEMHRRIGTGLLSGVALIPVTIVILLALSSRGLTGEVAHIAHTLTSTHEHLGGSPSRLIAVASTRPTYWRQGISVAVHHLLLGAGAGSFGIAHLRYPTASLSYVDAAHAHSYVIETFADFGIVGLVLGGLLLIAWLAAARRPLGWTAVSVQTAPGRAAGSGETSARPMLSAERDGMVALAGVVVAFGTSSSLDWTWFFPGVAIPALAAAGWLAGRGRLAEAVGDATPGRGAAGGSEPAGAGAHGPGRRTLLERPRAILGLTGLVVVTLVISYLVWQPLRSLQSDDAAGVAWAAGRAGPALADARAAEREDPLSLTAREELAAIDGAVGETAQARAELLSATRVQPDNPQAWSQLGQYELLHHQPHRALSALRRAAALDVTNATTPTLPSLLAHARSESDS